jgi:hypothetical protein
VLIRGITARKGDRLDDASRALDEAERCYRDLGHEAGLILVAWGRAELRAAGDDSDGAIGELDALASHPLIASRPALRISLLASRVAVGAARPEADLGALRSDYEAARDRHTPETLDLTVYPALATASAARGDWEAAEPLYRQALGAIRSLALAMAHADDRARFLRARAALIVDARECLVRLGKNRDAEELDAMLGDPEVLARERDEAQAARNRRLHRIGLMLALANVAVGILLVAASALLSVEDRNVLMIVCLMLVFAVLHATLAVIYRIALGLVSLMVPRLRRVGGLITIVLAAMAWVEWLTIVVIALTQPR